MYTRRSAVVEDALVLSRKLREIDLREIEVISEGHHSPLDALLAGVEKGATVGLGEQGQVLGMYGCSDHGPALGIPWLLVSDELFSGTKYRRQFLRDARDEVEGWQEKHALLTNYILADNTSSIRWLGRLGFKFWDTRRRGVLQFYRERQYV